jgi:predicted ATPase
LLILDNCEHVIAEAAALADALLRGCPHLRIFATSREPLRIAGERAYRLPSLRFPMPQEAFGLTAAGAAGYAATMLFAQRAQASDQRFALSDDNAPIVAEICRRLDGIPLAIELAAARVNILSVWALSQKLDQRFRILTGGDRTVLPCHQTMRALIDWSYDLLTAPEQRLFERLAVFAGGCTLAAATDVCDDDAVDELGLLELLTSLVDKSLVVADLDGPEPRYRLLESSRQYAREKLAARGEATRVAHRHALAYTDLAGRLEREYDVTSDSAWYARAEQELENLRAALDWALGARGDIVLGQRLAGAMRPVWVHLSCVEGLSRAIDGMMHEHTPAKPSALRRRGSYMSRSHGRSNTSLRLPSCLRTALKLTHRSQRLPCDCSATSTHESQFWVRHVNSPSNRNTTECSRCCARRSALMNLHASRPSAQA